MWKINASIYKREMPSPNWIIDNRFPVQFSLFQLFDNELSGSVSGKIPDRFQLSALSVPVCTPKLSFPETFSQVSVSFDHEVFNAKRLIKDSRPISFSVVVKTFIRKEHLVFKPNNRNVDKHSHHTS